MSARQKKTLSDNTVLIADENAHYRMIIADVLRGAGFVNMHYARDGEELLFMTAERVPDIVITSSRLPLGTLSGLEYTRRIRAGYGEVPRTTSIIITTSTANTAFVKAARESGVDEMLVRPFAAAALLARIEAVLVRPRRFIDSIAYVGPCRRRRMLDQYEGPLRRFSDPLEEVGNAPWEGETNRALVRQCVARICEFAALLAPGDRRRLRDMYQAVGDLKQTAEDVEDAAMVGAAASLGRYINAVGASAALDSEVISTHIDAMQRLSLLGGESDDERKSLATGLEAVVDKRLGKPAKSGSVEPVVA